MKADQKKYMIVRDVRSDKTYLDFSDTMIRIFERIERESSSKKNLLRSFPEAVDLTLKKEPHEYVP